MKNMMSLLRPLSGNAQQMNNNTALVKDVLAYEEHVISVKAIIRKCTSNNNTALIKNLVAQVPVPNLVKLKPTSQVREYLLFGSKHLFS